MISKREFRELKKGDVLVDVNGYWLVVDGYDDYHDTVCMGECDVNEDTGEWELLDGFYNPYTTYVDVHKCEKCN